MNKFKIGDKARLVSTAGYAPRLQPGDIFTVVRDGTLQGVWIGDGLAEFQMVNFYKNDFELVEESKNTLKFIPGDRVRLVTTGHGYICGEDDDRFFQVGCMGTVTDTNWTDGAIVAMDGFGDPVYFSYDEFELVEEPEVSNKTPSLVQKITPKNDDSSERDSQPSVDNNARFERKELPPIGTICEHEPAFPSTKWESVKIVSHHLFRDDEEPCAIFIRGEDVSFSSAEFFRPIKTAEEIEAEDREKVIEEMARVISSKVSDKRAAESLYELGYRKMGA